MPTNIDKEIKQIKARLKRIEKWIDFWETIPTPWKVTKKKHAKHR